MPSHPVKRPLKNYWGAYIPVPLCFCTIPPPQMLLSWMNSLPDGKKWVTPSAPFKVFADPKLNLMPGIFGKKAVWFPALPNNSLFGKKYRLHNRFSVQIRLPHRAGTGWSLQSYWPPLFQRADQRGSSIVWSALGADPTFLWKLFLIHRSLCIFFPVESLYPLLW